MKLKEIPNELLEPWYEKFERVFLVPAIPRTSGGWTYGFGGMESIYLGYGDNGYCQLIPESKEELYLFYIHIAPELRRKGHGKHFMRMIIELAHELNYKKLSLDVGYLNPDDRIPAAILRKFYKDLGFKKLKGTKMEIDLIDSTKDLVNSKLKLIT